jgi:integrase
MARIGEKLSPIKVRREKKPGMYGDGRGLWLHVGPSAPGSPDPLAAKSWIFRYMLRGTAREMGLGPLHTIGLADARQRAQAARQLCLDGIDPLDQKNDKKARDALEAAKAVTFKACAAKYVASNRAGWRNQKHAAQWDATLAAYVYPVIGQLPVGAIDTGHVTRILEPIWATKSETASRVRGRIEAVLDYAKTHGWREGVNPAAWRGHLENVLPKRSKVARIEHHAALPWQEIGGFLADLDKQEGMAALSMRFAILTAARTGETIGATWAEIDTQSAVWTVAGERMKAAREHRVPLSDAALAVLTAVAPLRDDRSGGFVFPGRRKGTPLSNMAMLVLLRRMNRTELTVHGFRSCFRDWAAETGQPADSAEAALAHSVGDKTVAAYQRGDLLERRRKLMADWALFATRPALPAEWRLSEPESGAVDSYTLLDAVARVAYGVDFDRYYATPGDTVAEADARQRRRLDLRIPRTTLGLPDVTGLAEKLDVLSHEISTFRLVGLWQESEQHVRAANAAIAAEKAAHQKIWREAAEKLRGWFAAGRFPAFDGTGKLSTEFWGKESVLKVLNHGYRVWADDLQHWMARQASGVHDHGPIQEHPSDGKPSAGELDAYYTPWIKMHPDASDAEVKAAANEHFKPRYVTNDMVTNVRRPPDGRRRRRGRKPGKPIARS